MAYGVDGWSSVSGVAARVMVRPRRRSIAVPTVLLLMAALVLLASPFDRFSISSIPFMRNASAVAGLSFVVLYLSYRRGIRIVAGPQWWTIAFLVAVAVMELVRLVLADVVPFTGTASVPRVALLYTTYVQPLVLFILLADVARDERSMRIVLFGLPVLMAVLAAGYFVSGEVGARWAPLGMNANGSGFVFGMAFLIALWRVLTDRFSTPGVRYVYLAVPALSFVGLAVSGSRGAVLATIVALAVLLPSSLGIRRSLLPMLAVVGLVVLSFPFISEITDPIATRLEQAVEGTSRGGRDTIWATAWDLYRESPWWGYGLQASSAVGAELREGRSLAVHNSFLSLLLAFGPVGLLLYLAIFASLLRRIWPYRRTAVGLLFIVLMVHVAGAMAFNDFLQSKYAWTMMALATQVPNWLARSHSSLTTAAVDQEAQLPVRQQRIGGAQHMRDSEPA